MAADERTSISSDSARAEFTMVPIRRRRVFARPDPRAAVDEQSDSQNDVGYPSGDDRVPGRVGTEPGAIAAEEDEAEQYAALVARTSRGLTEGPGALTPAEHNMMPIRRRRMFARPDPRAAVDADHGYGDPADDRFDERRAEPGHALAEPDESVTAGTSPDRTDVSDAQSGDRPTEGSPVGWRAAVRALEHAPDGSLYLPATTPFYLGVRNQPGPTDENVFGDDDDADYRPARVVRSSPGWEISKWFVAAAVALVFVLGSFLAIPAIFEPESNDAAASATAVAPTSAAPTVAARTPYHEIIMQASPTHYWRFAGGALGNDEMGTAPLTIGENVTYLGSSAVYGGIGSVDCAGTNKSLIMSTTEGTAPADFTVELWFSAATKEGGQLLGFNTKDSGVGGTDDRVVYMDRDGFLNFGVMVGSKRVAIRSDKQYNDGQWHHLVGTKVGNVITLYLDGVPVDSDELSGDMAVLESGYWRICGGPVNSWPRNGGKAQWAGSIDDIAVYPTAMTPDVVAAHHTAGV